MPRQNRTVAPPPATPAVTRLAAWLCVLAGVVFLWQSRPRAAGPGQDQLTKESRALAGELASSLVGQLMKEMGEKGPASAIGVCRDLAPATARDLSLRHGVKITRVSLKVRNPLLGTPDAWEQKVLLDFEKKAKKGADPQTLEHAAVVREPAGKYFRYMKALPVGGLCLNCHGEEQSMPQEIRDTLAKNYPHDRARGYKAGMIRGAISIKRPVR